MIENPWTFDYRAFQLLTIPISGAIEVAAFTISLRKWRGSAWTDAVSSAINRFDP